MDPYWLMICLNCYLSYRGWLYVQVGFVDELLVALAVSSQNPVSIRVSADDGDNLVAIPQKLTWNEFGSAYILCFKVEDFY